MAESSTCKSSTSHSHSHSLPRPGMKHKHHTWHGEVTHYRSHFEDFMKEIGEDAHLTHLCCLPRQAHRHERTRANSLPVMASQESSFQTEPVTEVRRRSPKGRGVRRPSAPAALETLATFSHTRERIRSSLSLPQDPSPKVRLPLKGLATTLVNVDSRPSPILYSSTSAGQRLKYVMRISKTEHRLENQREVDADLVDWAPLPSPPALTPAVSSMSSHALTASPPSFSRAPSFASFDTASSSEGPATPRGQSPLDSPVQEPPSPSLSYLEHTSRIRVPGVCYTCKKAGHNFSSCAVCGDTWCSRECRVVATGGGKHNCRRSIESSEIHSGPFAA